MKWLLLLGFVLLSLGVYAEGITIENGDVVSIDNSTYQISMQGSGENLKILIYDIENPSASENLEVLDCFETNLKEVCFVETKDCTKSFDKYTCVYCKEVSGNLTCERKNETLNPNTDILDAVFAEINDLPDKIGFIMSISDNDPKLKDEVEVELEFTETGDIFDLNFSLYLPPEIEILDMDTCDYVTNESGSYITLKRAEARKNDRCDFKITSLVPVKFELTPLLYYKFGGNIFKKSINSKAVDFTSPYTFTSKISDFDTSKKFNVSVTYSNPTKERIKFDEIVFNIPKEFYYGTNVGKSELGFDFYSLKEKFTLESGESEVFEFSFDTGRKRNYTIFISPKYTYDDKNFIEKYYDVVDVTFKDADEDLRECKNINFNISSDFNESISYFSGNDISFLIYMQSLTFEEIYNLSVEIYYEDKFLGSRNYDVISSDEKFLLSNIYSIIPFYDNSVEKQYKIVAKYKCGTKEYEEIGYIDLDIEGFGDLRIEKDVPKNMNKGDTKKITVEIKNSEDWAQKNIEVEEIIPDAFQVKGVTSRTLTVPADEKILAYEYEITLLDDSVEKLSLLTILKSNQNGVVRVEEKENVITIQDFGNDKVELELKDKDLFMFEPYKLVLEIENKINSPLENMIIQVVPSTNYDLAQQKWNLEYLGPNQTLFLDVPMFVKKNDIKINLSLTFDNETFIYEVEPKTFRTRSSLPYVYYDVYYNFLLNGSIETIYEIRNNGFSSINVSVPGKNKEIPARKTLNVTTYLNDKDDSYLGFKILNATYFVKASSENQDREKEVVKREEIDEVRVENPVVQKEVNETLEVVPQDVGMDNTKVIVFVAGGTAIVILLLSLLFVLRKKRYVTESIEALNIKESEEVEVSPEVPSNALEKKKEVKNYEEYESLKDELKKI